MKKLFKSKSQMYYSITAVILQVVMYILYFINSSDPLLDIYNSSAYKVSKILEPIANYILPIAIILFGIIVFRDKWIGFKALIISFPLIIISSIVMIPILINSSEKYKMAFMLFLSVFCCLGNSIVALIVIGIVSIISFIFKRIKKD